MNKVYYKVKQSFPKNKLFEMVKSKQTEIDEYLKTYIEQKVADKFAMAVMAYTISPKHVTKFKILPYGFSLKSTLDGIFDVVVMDTDTPIAKVFAQDDDYYIYAEKDVCDALCSILNIEVEDDIEDIDLDRGIGLYVGMESFIEGKCIPSITVGDIHDNLLSDEEYFTVFQKKYKYTPKSVDAFLKAYNKNMEVFFSKFK